MRRIALFVVVFALLLSACGVAPAAPEVANEAGALAPAIKLPEPPGFAEMSLAARSRGNYMIVSGTIASALASPSALEAAGYPAEIQQAASGLLSYEVMTARCVTWICLNRHSAAPVVPGMSDPTMRANGLWVSVAGIEGEPSPYVAFTNSAAYARAGISIRGFDPVVAQQKLLAAQTRLSQIAMNPSLAQPGELDFLTSYVSFESQRITFYQAVERGDPAYYQLWLRLQKIPVVVVAEMKPEEMVRRFEQAYQSGPGTRIKSGEIPLSRIMTVYIDASDASEDVVTIFRSQGLSVTVLGQEATQTENTITQAYNLWQKMPEKMYAFTYGVGQMAETVMQCATIAGTWLAIYTPGGIKVLDGLEVSASYQGMLDSHLGNFTPDEFAELNQDWLNKLLLTTMDPSTGISPYQGLADFVGDPFRGGWSSITIPVGGSATLDLRIVEGTAEHVVASDGMIVDKPAVAMDVQDVQVAYLGWTDRPQLQWQGVDLGANNTVYSGCVQYTDDPTLWVSFFWDVRWTSIPDRSVVRVYARPQIFISTECVTDITLR